MMDFGALMGIVMGMAQLWKKLGLTSRWIPLLNVGVAISLALIWLSELDMMTRLQQGLIIGLAASGLYDVGMSLGKHQDD